MRRAIGIIGGVGPYAGIDLVRKVFDNTIAVRDQEHIDLYMSSVPSIIGDRTNFLLNGGDNPAIGLYACFDKLATIGADVIAIPCNTAHAPPIYDEVAALARTHWPDVLLLNMIEETVKVIKAHFAGGATIGLMATLGTHGQRIYQNHFTDEPSFSLIEPDQEGKEAVHRAIYDQGYGIKATPSPSERARRVVKEQANLLIERGADAIILGCTELPLALKAGEVSAHLFDPTEILARAAIAHVAQGKLRP